MTFLKRIAFLFLFLILFLSLPSCGKSAETGVTAETEGFFEAGESREEKTEEEPEEETEEETLPPSTAEPSPTTITAPSTSTAPSHEHRFSVRSRTNADCTHTGTELQLCDCGISRSVTLPALGHRAEGKASCETPALCSRCRETVEKALGHDYASGMCKRCGEAQSQPYYVLDTLLEPDESASSIMRKLGAPTEMLWEGDLLSLVYADDLKRLTVIQTDKNGLWGIFTFDLAARFYLGGKSYSVSDFPSGLADPASHTRFVTVQSNRLVSFIDPDTNAGYALWFHYAECDYSYVSDPRITTDYAVQAKISFYFVNALRARIGLAPYRYDGTVAKIAESYAKHLTEDGVAFDHDGKSGDRLNEAGLSWSWWGENLSLGYENVFYVCDAYVHSPSHRANLLHREFTAIGCGFACDEDVVFGTQIFYKP